MMQAKKCLGVVVGSFDSEFHQDSFDEGEQVAKLIDDFGKFETCLIEVGKGPWRVHWDGDAASLDKEKCGAVVKKRRIKPEVVLIMTKGKISESGELQEYFDRMKIPFTFSGVEETRKTFNKLECNKFLKGEGLPVVSSILISNLKMATDEFLDKVEKQHGYPYIIKPNKGSGSCGVTKVDKREQVKEAVEVALKYDNQAVMEPAVVDGTEVTCTVHDITSDELLDAFPVTEISLDGEVFHTCGDSNSNILITPAKNLREEVIQEIVKVAKISYRALNLSSLATFDMIVQDDLPIILEVNSVPQIGLNSMIIRQVKAGLSFRWQRNIAKFYTTLADYSINNFPNIVSKKKANGGRGI